MTPECGFRKYDGRHELICTNPGTWPDARCKLHTTDPAVAEEKRQRYERRSRRAKLTRPNRRDRPPALLAADLLNMRVREFHALRVVAAVLERSDLA